MTGAVPPEVPPGSPPGDPLWSTAADDRARVDGLSAQVEALEDLVADLLEQKAAATGQVVGAAGGWAGSHRGPPVDGEPEAVQPRRYGCVADFVTLYFSLRFTRSKAGGRWCWCPRWWDHPEAVSRLTALWLSWERLHPQPGIGRSLWYRDHLDHHLPILMGQDGPFRECSDSYHGRPKPEVLSLVGPPDGHRVRLDVPRTAGR